MPESLSHALRCCARVCSLPSGLPDYNSQEWRCYTDCLANPTRYGCGGGGTGASDYAECVRRARERFNACIRGVQPGSDAERECRRAFEAERNECRRLAGRPPEAILGTSCDDCGVTNLGACIECVGGMLGRALQSVGVYLLFGLLTIIGIWIVVGR